MSVIGHSRRFRHRIARIPNHPAVYRRTAAADSFFQFAAFIHAHIRQILIQSHACSLLSYPVYYTMLSFKNPVAILFPTLYNRFWRVIAWHFQRMNFLIY